MTEETIVWTGHPSQWQNIGWFIACLLLVPIPFALWKWLETRDTKFEQGFFERMVGLGHVQLFTTDESSPGIVLPYILDAEAVREKIRGLVEARRDAKRVRFLETE